MLYTLPTARSMSPPTTPGGTSPRSPPRSRLTSPTSPTFGGRSRTPVNGRPIPSPSGRNRSATPLGVAASELDQFAEYCRAWCAPRCCCRKVRTHRVALHRYFDQDDNSGRLMTQTLANLPSSQRAPYSRLQASIRSAYHRSVNARRTAEFRAHLSATQPGGSLMPHARANPRGNVARKGACSGILKFLITLIITHFLRMESIAQNATSASSDSSGAGVRWGCPGHNPFSKHVRGFTMNDKLRIDSSS